MSDFGPESDSPDAAEESASEPCEAVSVDVRGQESPAERLRLAADLIEQRAAAATPGPWHPEHAYGNRARVQAVFVDCTATDGCDNRDCIDGTHGIGGFDRDPDNRWVLTADPRLGPLLAEHLRAEAAWCSATGTEADPHLRTVLALAIADLILGGDQ